MSVPLEVFCCYAREDQKMLEELKKHLRSFERQGQIKIWSDANIDAGTEWEKELRLHLERADLILLLISPDFINSEYCYSTEMKRAIERHDEGTAHVIPILLRYTHWHGAPFAKLQMVPTNAEPIAEWSSRDKAFYDVTGHIDRYISGHLNPQRTGALPKPDATRQTAGITSPGTKRPLPKANMCKVIPLAAELPTQPVPAHVLMPKGYRYLGKLDGLPTEHFFREKDGHVTLLATQLGNLRPFLIDKYAITNQQFCLFINDLLERKLAQTAYRKVTSCVSNDGHVLVWDAQECWQNKSEQDKAEHPWGITQRNGQWQPLEGCALLPATHVTWQGAQLYGRWVQNRPLNMQSVSLPTEQQWRLAALYDTQTKKERSYPWGKKWRRDVVNSGEYWAETEIPDQASMDRWWPTIRDRIRPLEVTTLAQGRSPIGCVQLIGNVWEWCSDALLDNPARRIIKGGCYHSPQEYCNPSLQASRDSEQANEDIGFRCAFTYKGSD